MIIKTIEKRKLSPSGSFWIHTEEWSSGLTDVPTLMIQAYNESGEYIGNLKDAKYICDEKGISPELRTPTSNTCSIGFCEKDQKWFGWSHRAIYGFGIGSEVKKGDCGFVPDNITQAKEKALSFWSDPGYDDIHVDEVTLTKEHVIVSVIWTYRTDIKLIPNEKLHGTNGGATMHFPIEMGKGEWIAKTLDDAKQMAKDFADGVG